MSTDLRRIPSTVSPGRYLLINEAVDRNTNRPRIGEVSVQITDRVNSVACYVPLAEILTALHALADTPTEETPAERLTRVAADVAASTGLTVADVAAAYTALAEAMAAPAEITTVEQLEALPAECLLRGGQPGYGPTYFVTNDLGDGRVMFEMAGDNLTWSAAEIIQEHAPLTLLHPAVTGTRVHESTPEAAAPVERREGPFVRLNADVGAAVAAFRSVFRRVTETHEAALLEQAVIRLHALKAWDTAHLTALADMVACGYTPLQLQLLAREISIETPPTVPDSCPACASPSPFLLQDPCSLDKWDAHEWHRSAVHHA